MKEGLDAHYGSLKAAAITLDVDPSQLNRELERLDRIADVDAKARVAHSLYEAFGNPDPKAIIRRVIRDARRQLDELAEMVEAL